MVSSKNVKVSQKHCFGTSVESFTCSSPSEQIRHVRKAYRMEHLLTFAKCGTRETQVFWLNFVGYMLTLRTVRPLKFLQKVLTGPRDSFRNQTETKAVTRPGNKFGSFLIAYRLMYFMKMFWSAYLHV